LEYRQFPGATQVQRAFAKGPGIQYFMHAHNVFFYGIKAGWLYVFDDETDELDPIGAIEPALETIMEEYEEAMEDLPDF